MQTSLKKVVFFCSSKKSIYDKELVIPNDTVFCTDMACLKIFFFNFPDQTEIEKTFGFPNIIHVQGTQT